MTTTYGDVGVTMEGHVAIVEIRRPPNNFFDHQLIKDLADAFDALDADANCRALVLCSDGKHFCAGANFQSGSSQSVDKDGNPSDGGALYREAVRMFSNTKPIVGAIQGAAIGHQA